MENDKSYELILDEIDKVLSDQNFKRANVKVEDYDNEITAFIGENIAYTVIYNDDNNQYILKTCGITEDNALDEEWKDINAWLYDPSNDTVKDAQNIANDFVESLSVKKTVSLASKAKKKKKKGDDGNVDSLFFMNRLVNIWPEIKDDIVYEKENYEYFRGVTFANEKVLTLFKSLVASNDEQKKKKLFNIMNDAYKLGDLDVRGIITIVLLNSIDDNSIIEDVKSYLSVELNKSYKYARKIKGKNIKPEKKKKKKRSIITNTLQQK